MINGRERCNEASMPHPVSAGGAGLPHPFFSPFLRYPAKTQENVHPLEKQKGGETDGISHICGRCAVYQAE